MSKTRILLAEDHETVREGLKLIVNAQSDMEVIAEVGDGRAAILRAQELQPDVVVMDVSMPKMNGLEATEKLKQVCPQIKVLTLTRHTDDGYLRLLLRAGVSGYVLKQSAATELIHAVRAVAAGGSYLDPAITKKVTNSYLDKRVKRQSQIQAGLTDREAEVLRLIAWGYTNKEIAGHLQISIKTVEAHKTNSMKKLNVRSRIDIVKYALLQGWLQEN
jgi:DNA-binding NarL/FixJ family response regulator